MVARAVFPGVPVVDRAGQNKNRGQYYRRQGDRCSPSVAEAGQKSLPIEDEVKGAGDDENHAEYFMEPMDGMAFYVNHHQ